MKPQTADAHRLDLADGRSLYSRVAGIFLFAPFLAQMRLEEIAAEAGMAGSKMIPAASYLLSLLALKLLDKERKSHITDWNFDEALGLFAGLNVPPKDSAAADYSYRLAGDQHNALMARWVKNAYPLLCPDGAREFALDFHPIPHRGEDSALENHYIPQRGKAAPSVQAFFARAVDSPWRATPAPISCAGNSTNCPGTSSSTGRASPASSPTGSTSTASSRPTPS